MGRARQRADVVRNPPGPQKAVGQWRVGSLSRRETFPFLLVVVTVGCFSAFALTTENRSYALASIAVSVAVLSMYFAFRNLRERRRERRFLWLERIAGAVQRVYGAPNEVERRFAQLELRIAIAAVKPDVQLPACTVVGERDPSAPVALLQGECAKALQEVVVIAELLARRV